MVRFATKVESTHLKIVLIATAALLVGALSLAAGPAWAAEPEDAGGQAAGQGTELAGAEGPAAAGEAAGAPAPAEGADGVGDEAAIGQEPGDLPAASVPEAAQVPDGDEPAPQAEPAAEEEEEASEQVEPVSAARATASKGSAPTAATSASQPVAAPAGSAGADRGTAKAAASAKTTAAAKAAGSSGPAEGVYVLRSALADRSVLDVAGGSAASGANVQLYQYNGTKAQRWRISLDKKSGLYTIASLVSGKVLDVSGASTRAGANVQVYQPNGTAAQRWRLVADGSGWRFVSALRSGLVLDISGGSSSDGANAQVWSSNKTAAQLFYLVSASAPVAVSTADVAEGAYVVRNAASGKVLDISGGSRGASANVQQYSANSTYAQRFYFEPDGKGYYRVYSVGSGLALDVSGADAMPGANVQQYSANGTRAQLWSLRANSDGTVTLLSCAGGNALDVAGASKASGANVQTYTPNGTKAQRFKLEAASLISVGGAVSLRTALAPSRGVDVKGGSSKSGAALQVYDHNGSAAQRFLVTKAPGGAVYLQPVCSRLYVGPSSSGALVQSASKAAWTLSFSKSGSRRGVVLALQGESTAVTAASGAQSAALKVSAAKGNANQAFLPEPASKEALVIDATVRNSFTGISLEGAKAIGIDVSVWNGDIDWRRVAASGISFAIIRCGYGSDYSNQDDKKFYANVSGARAAGIDIGVYLYSYATNTTMATSEAAHTLRLLKSAGLSARDLKYGVYYDIEDEDQMSISLEPICNTYCRAIKNAGYSVGVYSSLSWWNGRLSATSLNSWNRWVAQWPYKTGNRTCSYTGRYELWQCMSDGVVPGIVGNVDMDIAY